MIRPRFSTAFALLLAPCLALGCAEDDEIEPSVGGTTATMDDDLDDDHMHVDGEMHDDDLVDDVMVDDDVEGLDIEADPAEERPSEELEEQD